jgi:hypothetical protein
MKNTFLLFVISCSISLVGLGQVTKVLFIGNSYTGVNNLPQLTYDVSISTLDTLIIDSHTPGGTRFLNHASSSQALAKINSQQWNYVVLQAQSQEPSWPISQVQSDVFPYAVQLCNSIRANNVCTMPVFYMTWGRKNGDSFNCPNWPPVCTYEGMDSLLQERYKTMADDNNAFVSPVGAVWRFIRDAYPQIELYASDESHPSLAGSYAAACSFYTVFLRKDPTLISFDSGLPALEAENIRLAVKTVVFDNLVTWNVGSFDPVANFTSVDTTSSQSVTFTNQSLNSNSYFWDFDDGQTSIDNSPTHNFAVGSYQISLVSTNCGLNDTITKELNIVVNSQFDLQFKNEVKIFPNPTCENLSIQMNAYSNVEGAVFELFDELGNSVLKKTIVGKLTTISLRGISPGLYSYTVDDTSGKVVKY